MDYIDRRGGRFVTVLPRNRLEDAEFREWVQSNQPAWQKVWDRPNPRRQGGPRDRWYVFQAPLPSQEGWPVTWVYSALLALKQEHTRREQVATALQELGDLQERLAAPKSRLRQAADVDQQVDRILRHRQVKRYLKVRRLWHEEHQYRQMRRGRPGPQTPYRRITRRRPDLEWSLDQEAIDYDRKSDGMYPLLTNDRRLSPTQVLAAHKGQPKIEKRFEQTKTVHQIAPVLLKNEGRVEALFTLYFLALLVQALIERQLRLAMTAAALTHLPLYPEERQCKHPTAEQILRLFSHTQRSVLLEGHQIVQVFHPQLTDLQRQVLHLLDVPQQAYRVAP